MNDDIEQQPQTNTIITPSAKPARDKPSLGKILLLISFVVLLAVIAGSAFMIKQSQDKTTKANNKVSDLEKQLDGTKKELSDLKEANGEGNIKKDQFQSVFLKSGQIYFGKITKITKTQITLENIYYLRASNGEPITAGTNPGGAISLVKLGEELHGPEDVMQIERANVDFWENLKTDSQIAKAIKDYETKN